MNSFETLKSKIKNENDLTTKDWENYLSHWHNHAQGEAPKQFLCHKTKDGLSSYDILAKSIPLKNNDTILDLGCADAYFYSSIEKNHTHPFSYIGIDLSTVEIKNAKTKFKNLSSVELYVKNAQNMDFLKDNSVNHICSHMAFMLMNPIEAVIREIDRVLKPNGTFSTITISQQHDPRANEIGSILKSYFSKYLPNLKNLPTIDKRVFDDKSIADLFTQNSKLAEMQIESFEFTFGVPIEDVTDYFLNLYYIDLLNDEIRAQLKKEVYNYLSDNCQSSPLTRTFKLVKLTKAK